jgi:hypothetical protein
MAVAGPAPGEGSKNTRPAWLAPLVIVLVVVTLIGVGRKRAEAVENPLVDIAILTVGVFAFAAVFRFIATQLGSPGLASFFGAPPTESVD